MNQASTRPSGVDYLEFYRDELTDYHIYKALASVERNAKRRSALEEIASTELRHAEYWASKAKGRVKQLRIPIHPYLR
jgi:hypothetical protein